MFLQGSPELAETEGGIFNVKGLVFAGLPEQLEPMLDHQLLNGEDRLGIYLNKH